MFLNYFKNFYIKKYVKNKLSNVINLFQNAKVTTVGILIDETLFNKKEALIDQLINNGIDVNNIRLLVFKDKIQKKETFNYPIFSQSDLSWIAKIINKDAEAFIAEPFDLLINYYDVEKVSLIIATNESKAKFKVGFESIDKRLNHFIIESKIEDYGIFVTELFKYLKILNKI
jgi:hypothetical protein